MPFGIPESNDRALVSESESVRSELNKAYLRLQKYQAWLDDQSAVQRLRRTSPNHPILIARNSIIILSIIALFVLITSVVLPLMDGSYGRQIASLDSTFGMSFTSASLAILILTVFIWFALGVAASGFTDGLPLSPGEEAGLARIKEQIDILEKRLRALESSEAGGSLSAAPETHSRIALQDIVNPDIPGKAAGEDVEDPYSVGDWDPQPTSPGSPYDDLAFQSSSNYANQNSTRLLDKAEKESPVFAVQDLSATDRGAPVRAFSPVHHTGNNQAFGDLLDDNDLTVEVTDDPAGAWDGISSETNKPGVHSYTEVIDDISEDFELDDDPATEDLEGLWAHIDDAWLRNVMAQAERLADRLPSTAHIEISNQPFTPFTLVIERASPQVAARSLSQFVEFLASIPTPPRAAIELINVPNANRDFHEQVQSALQPRFPGKVTVTQSSTGVDIVLDGAYSGWSSYPHLPVDE